MISIVRCLEFDIHQVQCGSRRTDENDLEVFGNVSTRQLGTAHFELTFITELYSEMKFVNKSRYLVVYTKVNNI